MSMPKRVEFLVKNDALLHRFVEILPVGRVNARKALQLSRDLAMPYTRGCGPHTPKNGAGLTIRELALAAAFSGICVVGDINGYFIPATRQEFEEAMAPQELALRTKRARIAAVRRTARARFGVAA
jgi:hypothetical protein